MRDPLDPWEMLRGIDWIYIGLMVGGITLVTLGVIHPLLR